MPLVTSIASALIGTNSEGKGRWEGKLLIYLLAKLSFMMWMACSLEVPVLGSERDCMIISPTRQLTGKRRKTHVSKLKFGVVKHNLDIFNPI